MRSTIPTWTLFLICWLGPWSITMCSAISFLATRGKELRSLLGPQALEGAGESSFVEEKDKSFQSSAAPAKRRFAHSRLHFFACLFPFADQGWVFFLHAMTAYKRITSLGPGPPKLPFIQSGVGARWFSLISFPPPVYLPDFC